MIHTYTFRFRTVGEESFFMKRERGVKGASYTLSMKSRRSVRGALSHIVAEASKERLSLPHAEGRVKEVSGERPGRVFSLTELMTRALEA